MSKVHEIAVRVIRPGRDAKFFERRGKFIDKLKTQNGVLIDREFESLVAVPTPDDRPVYIGMTTYEALSTVSHVQMNPLVMMRFVPFFMTMTLKAYVFVEQTGGPEFDLDAIGRNGKLVQVWIRRHDPSKRAAFDQAHETFMNLFLGHEGIGPHYEFRPVKGNHIENLSVAITEYDSEETLEQAFEDLPNHPATTDYFATFEPVAVQFAKSV